MLLPVDQYAFDLMMVTVMVTVVVVEEVVLVDGVVVYLEEGLWIEVVAA